MFNKGTSIQGGYVAADLGRYFGFENVLLTSDYAT